MKISIQNESYLSIESNEDQLLYEIHYNKNHQIIVCDSHLNHIYTLKFYNNIILFYNLNNECIYQYSPLEIYYPTTHTGTGSTSSCLTPPNDSYNIQHFPLLNKLYNGVYGPHGIETIILKFENKNNLLSLITRLPSRDHWNTTDYVVTGRKITGDANVPADQISFIFNPKLEVKNLSRIAQFLSPAITFISTEDLQFISLTERLPYMVSCFKALGQINRQPGVWSPEWLRAYMIVYYPLDHPSRQSMDRNSPSSLPAGVAYSIIFLHGIGDNGNSDEDIDIDNDHIPQSIFEITRGHMIDFSISCWS